MTNQKIVIAIITVFFVQLSFAQGVGRLRVEADLSPIAAIDPTIELSVINMSSNEEMMRNKVSEFVRFSLPLNQRFLLYFKKDGYKTTRLMVDTHTFMSGIYTFSFNLEMDAETGGESVSIPIGIVKFNTRSSNFGYQTAENGSAKSLTVLSSMRESEVVRF